MHISSEDAFYNVIIAIIVIIGLRTVWLMIGNPLAFSEGCNICFLLVVIEDKIIAEKSIMCCNANLHFDVRYIIKVGLIFLRED